jgi:hypothetical protein
MRRPPNRKLTLVLAAMMLAALSATLSKSVEPRAASGVLASSFGKS